MVEQAINWLHLLTQQKLYKRPVRERSNRSRISLCTPRDSKFRQSFGFPVVIRVYVNG